MGLTGRASRQTTDESVESSPRLLKRGSFLKKLVMRFLTGASHIFVPFPALRLAEAHSDRGPSIVALETETCWIPPSAGARVRDPQRDACNHDATIPGPPSGTSSPRSKIVKSTPSSPSRTLF